MTISEKENILRHYRQQMPEHYPDLSYLHTLVGYGFLERPLEPETVALMGLEPEKYDQYRNAVSRKDWFGVEYVYEDGIASLPDTRKPPLISDITKWREQVSFPNLDDYDWDVAAQLDKVGQVDRDNKALSILIQCGIYERFHSLLGMEEALVSLIVEPEASAELLAAIADHKIELFKRIIEHYQPDIIRQHDDYGSQTSLQMSPTTWRELIKPQLARCVELVHSYGVRYEQHSCGFIEAIIPDFVELGIDSWQGMHINDVVALKKLTGNQLNYHMGLDVQGYMARDRAGKLTEEELRQSVRETLPTNSVGGFYFAVLALNERGWWGQPIIEDELKRVAATISYV